MLTGTCLQFLENNSTSYSIREYCFPLSWYSFCTDLLKVRISYGQDNTVSCDINTTQQYPTVSTPRTLSNNEDRSFKASALHWGRGGDKAILQVY